MLFIAAICALCLSTFGEAAHIKVGIYNAIPDLNGDGLQSYKVMIQDEYKKLTGNTVDAVVSRTEYDPYSNNLRGYLNTFDILEIDTTTLGKAHMLCTQSFIRCGMKLLCNMTVRIGTSNVPCGAHLLHVVYNYLTILSNRFVAMAFRQ